MPEIPAAPVPAPHHVLVVTTEPDGAVTYTVQCPGVTDECRAWLECDRCVIALARGDDTADELDAQLGGTGQAHGSPHVLTEDGWCVPTDLCAVAGHEDLHMVAAATHAPPGRWQITHEFYDFYDEGTALALTVLGPDGDTADPDRPAPAPLEMPYPPCSVCGETTTHDGDCLTCPSCGARWADVGAPGAWDEDEAGAVPPQCRSTIRPWADSERPNLRDLVLRCVLSEDHVTWPAPTRPDDARWNPEQRDRRRHQHPDSITGWDDNDPAIIVPRLEDDALAARLEWRDARQRAAWQARRDAAQAAREATRSA